MRSPTVPVRVLLVDDDERFVDVVRDLLASDGYVVAGAVHIGADVEGAIRDNSPDVIVLDLVLPDSDGLEVADRLRNAGDETPIIVFSSLFDRRVAAAALEDGYGFVEKTGGIDALELAIDAAMQLEGEIDLRDKPDQI